MTELHAALAARVDGWRAAGYPHDDYPTIAEILHFAVEGEDPEVPYPASGTLRYLRTAQFRALETYWYLRLIEGTPRIADLYRELFAQHQRPPRGPRPGRAGPRGSDPRHRVRGPDRPYPGPTTPSPARTAWTPSAKP